MRNLAGILVLAVVIGIVSRWVYSAALTPAEIDALKADAVEIDWEQVVDDPDERLTISWYPVPRFASGLEGAYGQRGVEERFNVDIEPIFADGAAYSRRKPLMFAGGSVPDLTWDGDPIDVQRDAFHGCLVSVPRWVIKKHAPTYYRLVSDHSAVSWLFAYYQGKNWGIPTVYFDGGYSAAGLWRMDWLRNVGIDQVPVDLEEWYRALYRLRYQDPDGNGERDTYGMSGNAVFWAFLFPEIFGAYGVLPFDWQEVDGKIVWGGVRPEAKEVLALLHDWYDQGLIDPEFVTDATDRRRIRNKFINGRIGYYWGEARFREFDTRYTPSLTNVISKISPEAEVVPSVFPRGPRSHRGARNWGPGGNVMVFGPGIQDKPQKAIRILKIFEYAVANGPEVYMHETRGQRGLHWDYREPDTGEPGTGPSSGYEELPPYDDRNVQQQEVMTCWNGGWCSPEYEDMHSPVEQIEFRDTYRKRAFCQVNALGKSGIVPSAQKYLLDLRNTQLTVFSEMIRGDRPVDDFEQFVEDWYARGGETMTKEANELLAVRNAIYDEVGATP